MPLFSLVVLFLTAFYAILLGSAAFGFVRGTRRSGELSTPLTVSVVIPARNEEDVIAACLDSVLANDYAALEVIVVDDGSTDATASIVRRYQEATPSVGRRFAAAGVFDGAEEIGEDAGVRLIHADDDPAAAHKKLALAKGVAEARGEIILTTDADCVVPPTWVRTMTGHFDAGTGMVTGPVLYRDEDTFFGRIQALEFLGLVAMGAGLIGIGRPHLCNSANLAYRRRAYEDVGGYEGIDDVSTGDDEMLLHKMAYESSWSVSTCMEGGAVVVTDPSSSLREFLAQRRRWASAHARYPHVRLTVTSVLCYLFFGALLAAAVVGRWDLLGAGLGVKIAAEAAVLWPATARFGRMSMLPLLLPAQVLHIPYILYIGAAGTFGGYEWKGRRVAR